MMPETVAGVLSPDTFRWLATLVLAAHLGLVIFVVLGLPAIVVGNLLAWPWANAPTWRWLHLLTIGVVVAEAWLGIVCPLTALERWLADQAGGGDPGHPAGFIAGWVERLLYYDLPAWVFIFAYSLFALAILAAWWRYPPRRRRPTPGGDGPAPAA